MDKLKHIVLTINRLKEAAIMIAYGEQSEKREWSELQEALTKLCSVWATDMNDRLMPASLARQRKEMSPAILRQSFKSAQIAAREVSNSLLAVMMDEAEAELERYDEAIEQFGEASENRSIDAVRAMSSLLDLIEGEDA